MKNPRPARMARLAAAALLLSLGPGASLTAGGPPPRRGAARPSRGDKRGVSASVSSSTAEAGDGSRQRAGRMRPSPGDGPDGPSTRSSRVRVRQVRRKRGGSQRGREAPARKTNGGTSYLRGGMFDHALLTKEEEVLYGRRVVRARELRDAVAELVESRELEREWEPPETYGHTWAHPDLDDVLRECDRAAYEILQEHNGENDESGESDEEVADRVSYELEHLAVYGYRPPRPSGFIPGMAAGGDDDGALAGHLDRHMEQLSGGDGDVGGAFEHGPRRRSDGRGATAAERRDYTPLLRVPLGRVSDDDAVTLLGLPGGRRELLEALLEGADARGTLMRRNAKLVVSISRTWLRRSYSTEGANGAGSVYDGSWDRPSLDEAVQEGMIGLARAADKYDPERGLRFATYATHWITSTVRLCFQRHATGCLRVPSQLHEIRQRYQRMAAECYERLDEPPGTADAAREIGVTERRLVAAVRATTPLLSLDAPIDAARGSSKGSGAGGDVGGGELILLDTLTSADPRPEDQVETSFLRQCLENAMAAELTPYERDVLRLRLGLDSGSSMSVREISDLSGGAVSLGEVRAVERRALARLRSPGSVHAHNLLAYLDGGGGGSASKAAGGRVR